MSGGPPARIRAGERAELSFCFSERERTSEGAFRKLGDTSLSLADPDPHPPAIRPTPESADRPITRPSCGPMREATFRASIGLARELRR